MGYSIDPHLVSKSYFCDAESFYSAFQILEKNFSNQTFYPKLYLLRHSVELSLKSLIFESPNGLAQLPPFVSKQNFSSTQSAKAKLVPREDRHSIKKLFNCFILDFPK